MKLERTKNATKGIIFGVILNLYKIIMKFIMRTAMIHFLGVEFLGLDSLFVSILKVLSLAELGVGSALTFSMYKPIADNDTESICALMKLYKIYYRIIGIAICIIGLAICPFIPYLIKSDVPSGINVYIIYIINLLATVFSYWLFAYKNSVIMAHQRTDVVSKITISVTTVQYILQLCVLYYLKNFYYYIIIALITQIVINIVTAIVANKMYPNYKARGTIEKSTIKSINQRVKDLFTSKVGSVVLNSADSIVISSFLGLTALAIFENYYYVITAVSSIVNVFFSSCVAGIGNSLIVETKEKNYKDLKKATFIMIWLITICTSCILCSVQNFISMWVGNEYLLNISVVVCLALYFYLSQLITIFTTYKDAAGIWHKDRFRALIASLVNVLLNVVLVQVFGMFGVALATVISLSTVAIPWLLHNIFSEIFSGKLNEYLKILFKYIIVSAIIIIINYFITNVVVMDNLISFLTRNVICVLISCLVWIFVFFKSSEMKSSITIMKKMISNIIK